MKKSVKNLIRSRRYAKYCRIVNASQLAARQWTGEKIAIGEKKNATGTPSSYQETSTGRASSNANCIRLATPVQVKTGQ